MARWLLSWLPRGAVKGPRLTILRHHRVYAESERPLYRLGVSEGVLEAQLGLLDSAGLTPVTVGEGMARLAQGGAGHWVAMSFDDGYADNVERALPKLLAAGARATFYLTSGPLEERRAVWWDELAHVLEASNASGEWRADDGTVLKLDLTTREGKRDALRRLVPRFRLEPAARGRALDRLRQAAGVSTPAPCEFATWSQAARLAEAGMEIGAHTVTHPHLTTLNPAGQRAEIHDSVTRIEARLGARPTGFAYPDGDHDADSIAAVRAAGLAHAVTTRAGDNVPGADPWTLLRRGLSEGACLDPAGRFSARLTLAEVHGAFDAWRPARGRVA
jgi:peptidoglycan/xylan/chitin deacetylase (PgdA/CDA1 family)